jgi:hypothetical protein
MQQSLDWGRAVQDLKDTEKTYGQTPSDTESLARAMLTFIRYTRIRQPNLFKQQRGEEYEQFVEMLKSQYDAGSLLRTLETESLWNATLALARRR